MGNRNDERECRNNDVDELETSDGRNLSSDEINDCHHRNRDRFADVLADAYNEGYKQGYCDGFKDGREKGRVEGFQEGCKAGQELAKQEVLCFIKRNRCCCRRNCC
ncbi:hypothetical protein psyc5s11_03960 [Clostridium gelidum]|uniref:Flagellar assembly protein H n=1 Tax=Clostridium gelidum TaxID=704125 RepID=A0ABM7SZJ6_9CLOT|nr:hypothetical protein [Clostridium gelidum]BCZ44329.1 hypothetical protein psyc5s11_03960 [Clostridium gelidum]